MTVQITVTLKCNHDGCKNLFSKTGPGESRATTVPLAVKEGWVWKDANTQFCHDHVPARNGNGNSKKAKVAKTLSKFAQRKTATKKASKPAVAVGGQSIGKLSRVAKMKSAPAAE
jgi:hypothetical protein